MLKTRIITALVLLPIVLVAVFVFADWGWAAFTFAVAMVATWEWSRFCPLSPAATAIYMLVTAVLAAGVVYIYLQGAVGGFSFAQLMQAGFAAAAIFWLIVVPLWLANSWRPRSRLLMALAGWLVIFPTSLALLYLRGISPWVFLSFATIVWVADISAYFVGRRFGKHKLAPAISPGKTIEGALGGMAGVMLFFFIWQFIITHSAASNAAWVQMLLSHSALLFALFVLLSVLSIIGDLFESWMKRGVGLKDSGKLLPGHGGILDRIDALTSTLPLAGLYLTLLPRL